MYQDHFPTRFKIPQTSTAIFTTTFEMLSERKNDHMTISQTFSVPSDKNDNSLK